MIRTTSMSQRLVLSAVLSIVAIVGGTTAFATNNKPCGCTPRPTTTTTKPTTTTTKPTTTTTAPPTTTTVKPTTTTTAPPTTTTVKPTTTTTAPPTTTTVKPTTTTTEPTTTTTTVPEPTTTVEPSTTVAGTVVTTPPVEVKGSNVSALPVTGSQTVFLTLLALALVGAGVAFVLFNRREPRIRMGVDSYRKW